VILSAAWVGSGHAERVAAKINCLIALSAHRAGAKTIVFCISRISSRRMDSICTWGDPYQTESVTPQDMIGSHVPMISVPTRAAQNLGCATPSWLNEVPDLRQR